MQKVELIGNVGNDATIRQPEKGGKPFLSFSVATTTRKVVEKETGELIRLEKTIWWSCTSYQIGLLEFLKKGTKVYVSGDYGFGIYENKEGKGKPDFKCFVDQIELLSVKKESDESGSELELETEEPASNKK